MIARYQRLTQINQVIVWILVFVAILFPLALMRTPDMYIRALLSGIALGGSFNGLLYWGEKRDQR